MRITLHAPQDLTLSDLAEEGLQISAGGEDVHFSAMEMFNTSLALCTASVLTAYAERIDAGLEGLAVRMRWEYGESPKRIGRITMDIRWPELPENRRKAAERAAAQCTLHHTLEMPPEVETRVAGPAGGAEV
ncbi:OsmC family protein [Thiohalorhabdus sp. Cl-TMA]|uniref:OsmC family protein n=1 Tax=Thiohalorhabdus methylotrophus TaxID=3242694 RepID=A0ABV4TXW3_9GAMM